MFLKYICGGVNRDTSVQHEIIETVSKKKKIKIVAQEAEIEIFLNTSLKETLENIDLAELCIISKASVKFHDQESMIINAKKANGEKCPVCWKINTSGCSRHS